MSKGELVGPYPSQKAWRPSCTRL